MRKHKQLSIRSKAKALQAWVSRKSVPLTVALLVTGIITLTFAYKFSIQAPHVKGAEVAAKKTTNESRDGFNPTTETGGVIDQSSSSDPVPASGSDSTKPASIPTPTTTPSPSPSSIVPAAPSPSSTPAPTPDPITPPPANTPSITISTDGCSVTTSATPGFTLGLTADGVASGNYTFPANGTLAEPTGGKANGTVNVAIFDASNTKVLEKSGIVTASAC